MTIRKRGGTYVLLSRKGKVLGRSKSRKAMVHREKQVVWFKNQKKYRKDHGRSIPGTRKKKK